MDTAKIHFQCPHCGKVISGSRDLAGRTVRCPRGECGGEMVVPAAAEAVAEPEVEVVAPPVVVPQTSTRPESFENEFAPNPYQSPRGMELQAETRARRETPGRVKAPGIALIVVGTLNTLYALFNGLHHLTNDGQAEELPAEFQNNEVLEGFWQGANQADPVVGVLVSIGMAIAAILVIVGGIGMIKQKYYGLGVTAAILSMLPCVTCLGCTGIGQIVGTWALVVLLNTDVKDGFR